jgi:hypothetical protein
LIVHAAVVFIPLQITAAIVYGVVPALRKQLWWAVAGLAVVAPGAAWAAKLSGEAFEQRLIGRGAAGSLIDEINQHAHYAGILAYLVLGLGVVMILQVWAANRARAQAPVVGQTAEITRDAAFIMGRPTGERFLSLVLAVIAVVLGVITAYYVFQTGDSGAHMVWSGS